MTAYKQIIDVDSLAKLQDGGRCRVVDCRFNLMEPEAGIREYREGHIPGAVFADLDKDLAAPVTGESGRHPLPDPDAFADLVSSWGVAKDTQVVVYDAASGALAARLWWLLRWAGHERVALLDGGMAAWIAAGYALEQEVPEYAPAAFSVNPDAGMVMGTAEVLANISGDTQFQLVDARDAARYRGEQEPIDPVAGHIPGAVNFPFSRSIDDSGRWRSVADLQEGWRKLGSADRPLVVMCGSGVTACHLVLSAIRAELPEPRVYVGSWSEWIRDPARPVAVEGGKS